MAGARADDEEVLAAARRVLETHPTVVSQHRMGRLLSDDLDKHRPGTSVTGERARRLLIDSPFCRVEYRTRDEPRPRAMYSCPICGASIQRVKNQTLFGGEVTLTIRCSRCKYWSGQRRRIPTLYTFHLRAPR